MINKRELNEVLDAMKSNLAQLKKSMASKTGKPLAFVAALEAQISVLEEELKKA